MQEYISDAIILNKTASGQMDARYSIFTKKFGKMIARATSSRKITSKLAGHLEPGSIARVRLIEQHGVRIVDALKSGSIVMDSGEDKNTNAVSHKDLYFLDRLLAENEQEPMIWSLLNAHKFDWTDALRTLGWDPVEAACSVCGASPVAGFSVRYQDFFCERCMKKGHNREIIQISGNQA